jgi:hypothetical protein
VACFALVTLAPGGVLHPAGAGAADDDVWAVATAILAAELLREVIHTVFVERRMGVDTIALVAMLARWRWASTWPG